MKISIILYYSFLFIACATPLCVFILNNELREQEKAQANHAINTARLQQYKLDSILLERAICDTDYVSDSLRQALRERVRQSKP